MNTTSFEDFYEIPNLTFDISKLREDLDKILKNKKFKLIKKFKFPFLAFEDRIYKKIN